MKKQIKTDYKVGVIVGRFHTHRLHSGHLPIFEQVTKNHSKVIVLLGISAAQNSFNDPLDFEMRKDMILSKFPDIIVSSIKDCDLDNLWSENLDERIEELITPSQKVIIYGGRDSFIPYYSGKFEIEELESEIFISASEIRKEISSSSFKKFIKDLSPEEAFRAGVIWSTQNRYDTCYCTVDIAITRIREGIDEILLVRKKNENFWRLPGGFADVNSPTYEHDAIREVNEELGIEISKPIYLGSSIIDDWRYRSQKDKIKTLFFKSNYVFGCPIPRDDIFEAKWFNHKLNKSEVFEPHYELMKTFLQDYLII